MIQLSASRLLLRRFHFICYLLIVCTSTCAMGSDDLKQLSVQAIAPNNLLPRVNVKEHGAVGDGVANDTEAFISACKVLNDAGTGTLVIPPGNYIVGKQTHLKGRTPYYQHSPMIALEQLDGLVIEGNGATLRIADGLHFGSFHPLTGERYDPETFPFTKTPYRVAVGNVISVHKSKNVWISDLEIDGNVSNLIVGGQWGDQGRQIEAYGIWLYDNSNVYIRNVHTHHHALDGIVVGYRHLNPADKPTPHYLEDVVSEYNARQGLSWDGGRGLTAVRCKFNHTGRAGLQSSPAAGLDIEAENSVCRDGLFVECEFLNNGGAGMVADSGDGGYSKFVNCTFWGSTNWAAWIHKPAMQFDYCRFFGSIVHGHGSPNRKLATQYNNCHFEDRDFPGVGCYRSTALVVQNGDNIQFNNCHIIAHKTKACYIDGTASKESLVNCIIEHRFASPKNHDFLSIFRGTALTNVTFRESLTDQPDHLYYIAAQDVSIGEGVNVAGPQCKIFNWSWGKIGEIEKTDPESAADR